MAPSCPPRRITSDGSRSPRLHDQGQGPQGHEDRALEEGPQAPEEERAVTERRIADLGGVPELENSHGGSFVSGLINAIASGLTHPGDVYAGRADPQDTG